MFDDIDAEPIDLPDVGPDPEHETRAAPRKPIPTADLQAIVDRHKADYDQRAYDYPPLGSPIKLTRGSAEWAKAFGRRRPQWFAFAVDVRPSGKRRTYLDLIRSEARQAFGPGAAEAVESLL